MGHTRQCQPRVLPLRELSPSCKTTSQRMFPLCSLHPGRDPGPRRSHGSVPSLGPLGCCRGTRMLPADPSWCWRAGTALSHSQCHGEVSYPVSNALPLSLMLVFLLSGFSPCFPDPAEALNLPNASLPSYRRTGCGKLFFLSFLLD